TIMPGQSVNLSFFVSNATSLVLNPGNINVLGKSSFSVMPSATTTYSLTASNSGGSVSASKAITVSAPTASLMPFVDITRIMTPAVGYSQFMIYPIPDYYVGTPSWTPGENSDVGAFRTVCSPSHMSFDDPIVFPGQPGKAHLHSFFGNTKTDAYSTTDSLLAGGNSTCRGGIANRSAYWMPTMIDTLDGRPIQARSLIVYYKTGYNNIPLSSFSNIPKGIHLLAGNSKATTAAEALDYRSVFKCIGINTDANYGYTKEIVNCKYGEELWQGITFPQCWNGVDLDSPDHKSHMSYVNEQGLCPSTHPVPLPEVTFNLIYTVGANDDLSRWRLSSDNYDKSLPGGYSNHGDWMFGWQQDIADAWMQNCDRAKRDCQAHLLGDGRYMEGP
ncbi:MAG: DUF1996 domain-containing protein, partial [Bacteriovoracaceae bacterium]